MLDMNKPALRAALPVLRAFLLVVGLCSAAWAMAQPAGGVGQSPSVPQQAPQAQQRVQQPAPAQADPISGLWAHAVPGLPRGLCLESYRYRPDGTGEDASAESRTSSLWQVVGPPDSQGFYRMTVRLQHNGKPDCSGNMPPVNRPILLQVRPHPSGHWMEMCGAASCMVLWRLRETSQ